MKVRQWPRNSFVQMVWLVSSGSETNASLLQRVRDPSNQESWTEFVQLYAPLIYAYGRKRKLQDADAADLAQDVMQITSRKMSEFDYDPQRGSFRGWLLTVTLNRIRQLSRSKTTRGTGRTSTIDLMHSQPSAEDESQWELLSRQRIFRWACQQIQSEFTEPTWRAFQMTAIAQMPAAEVAVELGVSTGSVYVSRSRVMSRLREKIAFVTAEK